MHPCIINYASVMRIEITIFFCFCFSNSYADKMIDGFQCFLGHLCKIPVSSSGLEDCCGLWPGHYPKGTHYNLVTSTVLSMVNVFLVILHVLSKYFYYGITKTVVFHSYSLTQQQYLFGERY